MPVRHLVQMDLSRRDTSWMEAAACLATEPELHFPDPSADPSEAVAVCRRCPVITTCADYALDLHATTNWHGLHGVWGGLTPTDRQQILAGRVNP